MARRTDDRQLSDLVKRFLEQNFPGVKIAAVNVRTRAGAEGDEYYDIHVVYDFDGRPLDLEKRVSLVREIRPKMEKIGRPLFPVFSFIPETELGKLKPEFA